MYPQEMLVSGLKGQEQRWDGDRAQALQGLGGVLTPAQAQDATLLQGSC